jgi:hypothetical protein
MNRLIILSDMFGNVKTDWYNHYISILKEFFEIEIYNCCKLAEINLEYFSKDQIHNQFVNGGIEKAVYNLLKKEKGLINILGFSIGGTIAWKAACKGLNVINFIAVSSTRLRVENTKPSCKIELFFAENDIYIPNNEWFSCIQLNKNIYKNETHDFYKKKEIAIEICDKLILNGTNNL